VHHSGSGRLAKPSPWGTSTSYSLPASWRSQLRVNRVVSRVRPALLLSPRLRSCCGIERMVETGQTRRGPRPSLHRLRCGLLRLVRRLHCYYGGIRLPTSVHHRLRLLAFPMRTATDGGQTWDLPVPVQGASAHARVFDHAGPPRRSRLSRPCVLPSVWSTASAPGIRFLSRLNGWPMRSPADASPVPSRTRTHGSGPVWVATPSLQRTCTSYSLPVSRRTVQKPAHKATLPRFPRERPDVA